MNGGRTNGLRDMLSRLNERFARRDPAIADEFAVDAILAGSDLSDLSRGKTAIAAHMASILALPFTLRFDWQRVDATVEGDAGWLFAEGRAVMVKPGGEESFDYHLSGVLEHGEGGWKWKLFHGSAPK
jgi:hypothetical protein